MAFRSGEVRGICYSPVPINASVYFAPYGDYFTAEYSFIWLRDIPLIKAMGARGLRRYDQPPALLQCGSREGEEPPRT